mmetsp:Transcript_50532/g.134147  ORF Transcript_50532/g.134147 Transcript_50532/m.134147 type:complete len:363 (+) Transcript_50532:894-1982(+)
MLTRAPPRSVKSSLVAVALVTLQVRRQLCLCSSTRWALCCNSATCASRAASRSRAATERASSSLRARSSATCRSASRSACASGALRRMKSRSRWAAFSSSPSMSWSLQAPRSMSPRPRCCWSAAATPLATPSNWLPSAVSAASSSCNNLVCSSARSRSSRNQARFLSYQPSQAWSLTAPCQHFTWALSASSSCGLSFARNSAAAGPCGTREQFHRLTAWLYSRCATWWLSASSRRARPSRSARDPSWAAARRRTCRQVLSHDAAPASPGPCSPGSWAASASSVGKLMPQRLRNWSQCIGPCGASAGRSSACLLEAPGSCMGTNSDWPRSGENSARPSGATRGPALLLKVGNSGTRAPRTSLS